MTKIFPGRINPSVLFAIIVFAFAACNLSSSPGNSSGQAAAQPHTSLPNLPHMWVPDALSSANEYNYQFLASLLRLDLGKGRDETDSIYYPADEFIGMIDEFSKDSCNRYVDVYFAAFGKYGTPYVPSKLLEGTLTPLFATVDTCKKQTKFYLLPEGAAGFNTSFRVPDTVASKWINNYITTKLRRLNPLLDTTDGDNRSPDSGELVSNTRHIIYWLSDFRELKDEVHYQDSLGNQISGFKLFFSSFNPLGNGLHPHANRLYVQLEFTTDKDSAHQVFHINPAGRGQQQPHQYYGGYVHPKAFDNGQMCPPTCTP